MIKYLFVLILLYLSQAKRIKQTYLIRSLRDWHYISKFGAETGEVFYSLTFRFKNVEENDERTIPIQYELFLDEEWPNAIEKSECDRSNVARRKETIQVPVKSEFEFKGSLTAKVRAHLWYFAFSDCEKKIRNSFPVERKVKLEVELHIKNVGGTEFTLEQFGILQIIGVIALIDVIMLIYNGNQILDKQRKYEEFSLPLFLLVITLLLETFSYCFLTIHLWIYSENGAGSLFLQVLSVIFQVASQFSLTMILVMLSWGWQINFSKFDNFELFIPISILIGFFQITIVGVSFIDYDAYYKDHQYEGWVGWLAALIYIGEFVYFMNGLVDTYNKQNTKIQQFILLLGLYGGVYFISFPVLQTVNLFTARYVRYKVMEIGTMLFRTSAILLLTRLFTSKNSIFAQISIENKSFLDRNKDERKQCISMSKEKKIESSMLTFFVQEMNQDFWEQTQTTELDSQEFLIEHEFVREAKKEVKVKHTLLVMGEEYLYKISPKQNLKRVPLNILHFDTIPKLPEDHILQLNSENQLQGFKLTYASKILQVFTSNSVVFLQWQAILKRKCLLSSFHEKYHVEKMIGKGSFAKVYLATSNGQSYAIKAFSKQFINEQLKGKESLLNEMQVMRAIKHPNIVQLLEVHETQNSIYFVLELVVGGELLQRVKEKGLLKSDDLIKIAFNLLSALDHLHQKKIFHRDLKPENLLLKSKEDNYNIMIADFGLAAFSDQELIFKRCGTPGFVAPEILLYIDGGPIYDTKCDIFSAGVILYILITGKQPFPGQDQKAILKANKACQIDFGLPAFLKTPIEFQDLVKKMLSNKISDRPTAQDCLKHKLFAKISQQLKQDQQELEEQQQQVLNNLASYDLEYTIGLKNNTQNSEDLVGSQQLQWRKPAYNGNVQTVETLTNCSTVSIKQIDAQSTSQSQYC